MALNDKTQRVVLKFNVDAGGVILGVQQITNELGKAEKKAKDTGKSFSDYWGGIDSAVEKAKRGFADLTKIGGFAIDQFKFALEASRLEIGAAGVSIEGLRKASAGLKTDMQLLSDAVKFKSAAFKLDQQAMEDVEGAMRSLERKGKDATKVNEALTQALTKLSTEGLQELGIRVEKAGLSMDDAADRAELFKRVMAAVRSESLGVADAELTKEERMAASGVAFENAVDSIKRSLGEMVVALAPIIQKVAELVGWIGKLPSVGRNLGSNAYEGVQAAKKGGANFLASQLGYDMNFKGPGGKVLAGALTQTPYLVQNLLRETRRNRQLEEPGSVSDDFSFDDVVSAAYSALKNSGYSGPGAEAPIGKSYKGKGARDKDAAEAKRAAEKLTEAIHELLNKGLFALSDASDRLGDEAVGVARAAGENLFFGDARDDSEIGGLQRKLTGEDQRMQVMNLKQYAEAVGETAMGMVDAVLAAADKAELKDNKSMLESLFGTPDEFDMYKTLFDGLTGAIGSAYGAWIDGSMSAGAAFKKSIGEMLKATAIHALVEALKNTAIGIGYSIVEPAKAAASFAAAAKWGAVAVAAGAGAKALGGGGGGSASSGGGSYGGGANAAAPRPGGSTPAESQRTVIHIVGDPYDTESNPRRRQNNAKKILRQLDSNHYAVDK